MNNAEKGENQFLATAKKKQILDGIDEVLSAIEYETQYLKTGNTLSDYRSRITLNYPLFCKVHSQSIETPKPKRKRSKKKKDPQQQQQLQTPSSASASPLEPLADVPTTPTFTNNIPSAVEQTPLDTTTLPPAMRQLYTNSESKKRKRPLPPQIDNLEELIKEEDKILAGEEEVMIAVRDLQSQGKWLQNQSLKKKTPEPKRNKTRWDFLLEEMEWLAEDFRKERAWKNETAEKIAEKAELFCKTINKRNERQRIEEEKNAVKTSKKIANTVLKEFWDKIDKIVLITQKQRIDEKKEKYRVEKRDYLVQKTEAFSQMISAEFASITPNTPRDPVQDEDSNMSQGTENSNPPTTSSQAPHYEEEIRDDDHISTGNEDEDEEEEEDEHLKIDLDEVDDESTLIEAEKDIDQKNCGDELSALEQDADVPMEELLKKYHPELYQNKNTQEKPKETKAQQKEAPTKKKPEETSQKDETDSGMAPKFSEASKSALEFQPKGFTLATTKVNTPIPFLLTQNLKLREYQHIGLDWLVTMHEKNFNGILADEMGLGKTIQTISLLAHLACEKQIWGQHLVVVPSSVMLNWEIEFKKWCPSLKILTYYGNPKERAQKRQGWNNPNSFHVCITSYNLVVQDVAVFKRKKWHYLILDEAHHIKNFKSKCWQTLLTFKTDKRLLLTGTPLQNNLMELWALMHFLMPELFESHSEFKEWFSNPLNAMIEGKTSMDQDLVKRLHSVLRPFILRRLKKDVEKQMPQKYEHVVKTNLSKRQRCLYEDFMSKSDTQQTLIEGNLFKIINVLMQLRKVCNHPDLFEERPILSPFTMVPLDFEVPSSVFEIMDILEDKMRSMTTQGLSFLENEFKYCQNGLDEDSGEKNRIESMTKALMSKQDDEIKDLLTQFSTMRPISAFLLSTNIEEPTETPIFKKMKSRIIERFNFMIKQQKTALRDYHVMYGRQLVNCVTIWKPQLEKTISRPINIRKTQKIVTDIPSDQPKGKLIRDFETEYCPINTPDDFKRFFKPLPRKIGQDKRIQQENDDSYNTNNRMLFTTPENIVETDKVSFFLQNNAICLIPKIQVSNINCAPAHQSVGYSKFLKENNTSSKDRIFSPLVNPFWKYWKRQKMNFPEKKLIQYDCGKLQTLEKLLSRLRSEGHRVLIFTQMSKMLDILEKFLCFHDYTYFRLDGSTKIEYRQYLMERFNRDPKIFAFILSTRSGGLGINLTGADTVVFYDSDWNPAMDLQAQDRCHRIGQTRDVHIYRLISESTIEERILQKSNQKKEMNRVVIQCGGFTPDFLKNTSKLKELFSKDSNGSTNFLKDVDMSGETGNLTTQPEEGPRMLDENLNSNDEETYSGKRNAASEEQEVTTLLEKVEDEADVIAMKNAETEEQEANRELEEVNEGAERSGGDSNELLPIEKYGLRFKEMQTSEAVVQELISVEEDERRKQSEWKMGFDEIQKKKVEESITSPTLRQKFFSSFSSPQTGLDEENSNEASSFISQAGQATGSRKEGDEEGATKQRSSTTRGRGRGRGRKSSSKSTRKETRSKKKNSKNEEEAASETPRTRSRTRSEVKYEEIDLEDEEDEEDDSDEEEVVEVSKNTTQQAPQTPKIANDQNSSQILSDNQQQSISNPNQTPIANTSQKPSISANRRPRSGRTPPKTIPEQLQELLQAQQQQKQLQQTPQQNPIQPEQPKNFAPTPIQDKKPIIVQQNNNNTLQQQQQEMIQFQQQQQAKLLLSQQQQQYNMQKSLLQTPTKPTASEPQGPQADSFLQKIQSPHINSQQSQLNTPPQQQKMNMGQLQSYQQWLQPQIPQTQVVMNPQQFGAPTNNIFSYPQLQQKGALNLAQQQQIVNQLQNLPQAQQIQHLPLNQQPPNLFLLQQQQKLQQPQQMEQNLFLNQNQNQLRMAQQQAQQSYLQQFQAQQQINQMQQAQQSKLQHQQAQQHFGQPINQLQLEQLLQLQQQQGFKFQQPQQQQNVPNSTNFHIMPNSNPALNPNAKQFR